MTGSLKKNEIPLEALREALESGSLSPVQRMMRSLHPAEIADLLESLPPPDRNVVWELVEADDEGEVLLEVNDEVRAGLIQSMATQELIEAADGLEVDDLADFIDDLPEAVTQGVLDSMGRRDRQRLESVLAHSEDSAGGLMNIDTVTVRPDVTLDVVLRYMRARGELPDGTDKLFVIDRHDKFLGALRLSVILTSNLQKTVADVMDSDAIAVQVDMKAADVARVFENRNLLSAAVVNESGILVGRITVDDVVDVIRDEAEHSLMSMAGLDEEDDMFAPVLSSARRRAVWLAVNLATAFVAAWIVGLFEATIEKVVALAVLMPVVASMGGIAGTQTLTLIIRGIALGYVDSRNARTLLRREIAVALLNGLIWALIVAVVAMLWFKTWKIGAVIAAALAINLLVAALAGVLVPLTLKRLKIDPALAGGVVLTTITDVIGFLAFLGLGAMFLTG